MPLPFICVFAFILPQQRQKDMAVYTQAARTDEAGNILYMTQTALTPTISEIPITSLEQACKSRQFQGVQLTGKIILSVMAATNNDVFITGLDFNQGEAQAYLKNVLVCGVDHKNNCVYFPKEDYTQKDLRGIDAAGVEFSAGDEVIINGLVITPGNSCEIKVKTIQSASD